MKIDKKNFKLTCTYLNVNLFDDYKYGEILCEYKWKLHEIAHYLI